MALVTLEQAKAQLRVVSTTEDDDIAAKIEQASASIIDYVDRADVTATWDEDTVPEPARAATLELLLFLYERDVTVNQRPSSNTDDLPPRVVMHLRRLQRWALA